MAKAGYRKINDGSRNSSKFHKLDGTPVRAILKRGAAAEVAFSEAVADASSAPCHLQAVLLRKRWEPVDEPLCTTWRDPIHGTEVHWTAAAQIVELRAG